MNILILLHSLHCSSNRKYLIHIAHLKFHLISYLFIIDIQDIKNSYAIMLITGHIYIGNTLSLIIRIDNLPFCKILKHIWIVSNWWRKIFLVYSDQLVYTRK